MALPTERLTESGKADEWQLAAEEIKQDILANGVDERGVLTQYYGSTALDASLFDRPLVSATAPIRSFLFIAFPHCGSPPHEGEPRRATLCRF